MGPSDSSVDAVSGRAPPKPANPPGPGVEDGVAAITSSIFAASASSFSGTKGSLGSAGGSPGTVGTGQPAGSSRQPGVVAQIEGRACWKQGSQQGTHAAEQSPQPGGGDGPTGPEIVFMKPTLGSLPEDGSAGQQGGAPLPGFRSLQQSRHSNKTWRSSSRHSNNTGSELGSTLGLGSLPPGGPQLGTAESGSSRVQKTWWSSVYNIKQGGDSKPPSPSLRQAVFPERKRKKSQKNSKGRPLPPNSRPSNQIHSHELRDFIMCHAVFIHERIAQIKMAAAAGSQQAKNQEIAELLQWLGNAAQQPRQVIVEELVSAFPTDLQVSDHGGWLELLGLHWPEERPFWKNCSSWDQVGFDRHVGEATRRLPGHGKRNSTLPGEAKFTVRFPPLTTSKGQWRAEKLAREDSAGSTQVWQARVVKSVSTGWAPYGAGRPTERVLMTPVLAVDDRQSPIPQLLLPRIKSGVRKGILQPVVEEDHDHTRARSSLL